MHFLDKENKFIELSPLRKQSRLTCHGNWYISIHFLIIFFFFFLTLTMETFSIQLDSFFRWKQKEPQLYYATILKYCPQFWEAPLPIIQRFSDKWSLLLFLVFQPIHSRTQFKWSACMKSGFSLIFYFAVPKKEKKKKSISFQMCNRL